MERTLGDGGSEGGEDDGCADHGGVEGFEVFEGAFDDGERGVGGEVVGKLGGRAGVDDYFGVWKVGEYFADEKETDTACCTEDEDFSSLSAHRCSRGGGGGSRQRR